MPDEVTPPESAHDPPNRTDPQDGRRYPREYPPTEAQR